MLSFLKLTKFFLMKLTTESCLSLLRLNVDEVDVLEISYATHHPTLDLSSEANRCFLWVSRRTKEPQVTMIFEQERKRYVNWPCEVLDGLGTLELHHNNIVKHTALSLTTSLSCRCSQRQV
jgi:hypothetical protein